MAAIYHFVDGTIDRDLYAKCHEGCYFPTVIAKGDFEGLPITGVDLGAQKVRSRGPASRRDIFALIRSWFN